jgi:crotonobetainyl-CoA:carnitine CoA-transferase CaiB-like acyl-CoA transferase
MMRLIVPDKVTALTSAQAITAALVQRGRTGKGTHIDLCMLDAVVNFTWAEAFAQEAVVDGQTPNHTYSRDMIFKTQDGYITCGAVQEKEWRALCAALDQPQWLADERFSTVAARSMNRGIRFQMTADVLQTMTSSEAIGRLTHHQVYPIRSFLHIKR